MYLDRTYQYKGERSTATQSLEFPRAELYDTLGNAVTGVPDAIKQATCLAAIRLVNGTSLEPDVGRRTVREKIDVIDITYAENSSSYTRYTEIDNLLKSSGFIMSNRNSTVNIRLVQR
jgi:hypothetical protein